MRVTLNALWIQNTVLVGIILTALIFLFLGRSSIEMLATPAFFFYAVVATALSLTALIYMLVLIYKRAEAISRARTADLLETQKLFVELYRNSPVPYVLIDHTGAVTYPNHAAVRLFGLDEGVTFEGRNIFEMFTVPDDEDGMEMSIVSARFKEGVFVDARDVVVLRDDGTTRYGLLSIFPYGSFGTGKKGLMTIVDITKQKEIEKAKTEFVSMASHQLRTPISAMKWNLELMQSPQNGTLSEGQTLYFKKITNTLRKMNVLIDDFLNVSQLELGTKHIQFEKVELLPFVESICEDFVGRVSEKGLKLEKQFDERITSIETDVSLLHMIVNNLVSNATKYTPEGGTIRLQYTSGYDTLTVSVSDTGVGIPKQDQEKLFTKFFRAENVRKNVTSGTGLGLYIVKLAVEKLGGTIKVQSEVGQGTTFVVVLPHRSGGRMAKTN